MAYEIEIVGRKTPTSKSGSPIQERTPVSAKRTAIRTARKEVRTLWAKGATTYYEIRANVFAVNGGRPMLIRQVYINADTAQNGFRKMLRDEEL